MLSNRWVLLLLTAVAPGVWGTTYIATAELLPPDRPLLAAVLRSLPAGLVLLLIVRRVPRGSWWWRSLLLGALNIGVFFALLFIAAYRLPGGVAATVGAVQPILITVLASRWIGEQLTVRKVAAGLAGLAGVALLVLQAQARLDLLGVGAALGGALAMACGVVLTKKWGRPDTLLATTAWQLIGGGLVLAPLVLLLEGPLPDSLTPSNIAGYAYLGIIGTALAYTLWFRGVHLLPASTTALLGLLSPLVATLCGWALLSETLSPGQVTGAAIILVTLIAHAAPVRQKFAKADQARAPDSIPR
ncbi:EamA family transporter [Arthrobacter sp. Br18]|uniref:EamA family transporter n=1 Tax=Arthrobacter sp. Br18 TaxID=1312954 RepID=UPI00055B9A57|nr:EamA family transporter [Arthrobacter sp. Br18]